MLGQVYVKGSARLATPINLSADTVAPNVPNNAFDAIYVGVTGNIVVDTPGVDGQRGSTGVTFNNVPVGMFAVSCSKVYSSANGTTASDLVGLNW